LVFFAAPPHKAFAQISGQQKIPRLPVDCPRYGGMRTVFAQRLCKHADAAKTAVRLLRCATCLVFCVAATEAMSKFFCEANTYASHADHKKICHACAAAPLHFCRRHRADKKMQFSQQPRKKHVAAVALVLLSSFSYSYDVKNMQELFYLLSFVSNDDE